MDIKKIYTNKKFKIIVGTVVGLILLYTLIGFLALPYGLKYYVPKIIQEKTGRASSIEKIYINPYLFKVEIDRFALKEANVTIVEPQATAMNDNTTIAKDINAGNKDNFVSFGKIALDFEFWSVFEEALRLKYFRINEPYVHVEIQKDKKFNFADILEKLASNDANATDANASDANKSGMLAVTIEDFDINNSKFSFEDNSRATPFDVTVKDFDFNVKNLTTLENKKGDMDSDIELASIQHIKNRSKISITPFDISGELILKGANIAKFYTYAQPKNPLKLDGAVMDATIRYSIKDTNESLLAAINDTAFIIDNIKARQANNSANIGSAGLKISDVSFDTKKGGYANIEAFGIKNVSVSDGKSTANMGALNINGIHVNTKPGVKGKVNTVKLDTLSVANAGKKAATLGGIEVDNINFDLQNQEYAVDAVNLAALNLDVELYKDMTTNLQKLIPVPSKTTPTPDTKEAAIQKDTNASSAKQPNFLVKKVALTDSNINFTDLRAKKPINLKISNINTTLQNVTLKKDEKILYDLSLNTPKKGTLKLGGSCKLDPSFSTTAKLAMNRVDLTSYNPYIQQFANIDLRSGSLNDTIDINFAGAASASGNIELQNLTLYNKLNRKKIFGLKDLKVKKLKFHDNRLTIYNVYLNGMYADIAIDKDKNINLANLMVEQPKSKSTPSKSTGKATKGKKSKPFSYGITKIQFVNGVIDFKDDSLPLRFKTRIHSLKGDAVAISSNPRSSTKLTLDGVVNKYGMANIRGSITPADFKNKTDIGVKFSNIDVPSLSPYTTKFIGYKIEKGKLWLDLDYKIKKAQLNSKNDLRLKDLTLGEKMEVNGSIDAPIGLAVALLTDSNGFIDVSVPVTGDLNNPEFHFGGAIWHAVGVILTNIVTAPFRFLGGLLGLDSDEMANIGFDYGDGELIPSSQEKLDNVVKAFDSRPQLAVALSRVYDKKEDADAMKIVKFKDEMLKKYEEKEYEEGKFDFLEDEFEERYGGDPMDAIKEKFEKEADANGSDFDEEAYVDALADKMIADTPISEKELHDLGEKRVQNTKAYLLSKGIAARRIVVNEGFVDEAGDDGVVNMELGVDADLSEGPVRQDANATIPERKAPDANKTAPKMPKK